MYRYTLKSYLKSKYKSSQRYGRAYMDYSFAKTIVDGPVDYQMGRTLSRHLDVVFYSKNRLQYVPASNGVLVPAALYNEEKIGELNEGCWSN